MVAIVSEAHHYVPVIEYTATKRIESINEEVPVPSAIYHHIFFGGNQLTAARVRSAQKHMCNADTPAKRLVGFHAMIEDWHTKLTFMEVSIPVTLEKYCIQVYVMLVCICSILHGIAWWMGDKR